MCISCNLQASLSRTKSHFLECDHHEGRSLCLPVCVGGDLHKCRWQTSLTALAPTTAATFCFSTLPSPSLSPSFAPSLITLGKWARSSVLSLLLSRTSGCVHLWHFFLLLSVSFPLWSHPFVLLLLLLSRSVVSDSLWPHGLQHARPPCPSLSPRVYSNLCPWSQWCHPAISSSVVPFSSSLQPFPASGSFPVSQLFTSGGQSIGASASVNDSDLWIPLYFMSLDPTVLYVFGSHCTLCVIFSSEQNFTVWTFLLFSFLWRPSQAKLIFLAYSQWPTNPSRTPQRFHPLQMLSVFKRATYFFFQSKYFKRFLK